MKKKYWIILLIVILVIGGIFFFKNRVKNSKLGNNKTSQEIVDNILNVNSYKAKVSVQINSNKNEIATLQKKYSEELELEEDYKNQINKLQDPEYVARRIREKHLYSGKNEIVIKIED